jgi:hypothetical protein
VDTFSNGVTGALITDRAGEVGATWFAHPSFSTALRISNASRAYFSGVDTWALVYPSASDTSTNMVFRTTLRWLSAAAAGIHDGGIAVRLRATAPEHCYLVWWQTANAPVGLHIYRGLEGVFSSLTNVLLGPPTVGTDYVLTVSMQGSRITATLSGGTTAQIAATDTAISTETRAGIRAYSLVGGTNSTGLHFDNVVRSTFSSNLTSIVTDVVSQPSWVAASTPSATWTPTATPSTTTWATPS